MPAAIVMPTSQMLLRSSKYHYSSNSYVGLEIWGFLYETRKSGISTISVIINFIYFRM